MESKSAIATRILQEFVHSFHPPFPWCYGVRFDESDKDSIALLFGIDLEMLDELFLACGVLYSHGKTFRLSHAKLKQIVCVRSDVKVEKAIPSGFSTHAVFIKIGKGCWTAAEQYREGQERRDPPRHTRQVKMAQRKLQDEIALKFHTDEGERQHNPPQETAPHTPNSASSGTADQIISEMGQLEILTDHINPKYLSSSEFWAEGSSAEARKPL
jgi:hypothetical protein